jgi:tRNA1Val (adenine37-N6)-methyltransferase
MANLPFRFRLFDIHHDKCAMKVGTDGVLLGAWCNIAGAERALDIGTGSGLIALMIAQRNPWCYIDAVEIDDASSRQAAGNVLQSPWKSRINIHHISFREFCSRSRDRYDLIVSNPPYFQNSLLNPEAQKSAARHASALPVSELITGVMDLLEPKGRYCMIMPVTEARLFIIRARENGLFCNLITSVLPNPGKPPQKTAARIHPPGG